MTESDWQVCRSVPSEIRRRRITMEQYPMLRYFCYRRSFNRVHRQSLKIDFAISFQLSFTLYTSRNEIFTQRTYKNFKIDKQLEKKLSVPGISDIKDLNREPACGTMNQGSSKPRICKYANLFFKFSNGDENRNLINSLLCRLIMVYNQESRELP